MTDPYGEIVAFDSSVSHPEGPAWVSAHPPHRGMRSNNDEVLDFYVNVFGFRELTTSRRIRAQ